MLELGTYSFTAQVTSSMDDPTPEDNTLTREFEISENIYSLDGLYNSSEWMGTGWPWMVMTPLMALDLLISLILKKSFINHYHY